MGGACSNAAKHTSDRDRIEANFNGKSAVLTTSPFVTTMHPASNGAFVNQLATTAFASRPVTPSEALVMQSFSRREIPTQVPPSPIKAPPQGLFVGQPQQVFVPGLVQNTSFVASHPEYQHPIPPQSSMVTSVVVPPPENFTAEVVGFFRVDQYGNRVWTEKIPRADGLIPQNSLDKYGNAVRVYHPTS